MSDQVISESSTGGKKEVKEARMSLLPWDVLRDLSELYAFGARKYAAHNWRLGYEYSKSIDALGRHFQQWVMGEDTDEETGKSHLLSVMFHAAVLHYFNKTPKLQARFDDRFTLE